MVAAPAARGPQPDGHRDPVMVPQVHRVGAQRILLVEPDRELGALLARRLWAHDFDVVIAGDGESALRRAADPPDAIVLEIDLPDADGRDVCQAFRARGVDAPVIFVTMRRDVTHRLSCFAAGGDDHLAKPFALPELVARLRALLRRHVRPATAALELQVDPIGHCVRMGERRAELSPTEYRLIARLVGDRGAVVRRAELRAAGWPAGAIVSDNTLDQFLSRIRRKLVAIDAPVTIRSARGIGYEAVPTREVRTG